MPGPSDNVWRDPQVEIGPYRILPRTDGRFLAYDDRMPPGERAAFIGETLAETIAGAKALVARGAPLGVVAAEPPPREVSTSRQKRSRAPGGLLTGDEPTPNRAAPPRTRRGGAA